MQFYETNEIQLWGPKARKKGVCFYFWEMNETPEIDGIKTYETHEIHRHKNGKKSFSFYETNIAFLCAAPVFILYCLVLKNSCIDDSLPSGVFDWAPYEIDERRLRSKNF